MDRNDGKVNGIRLLCLDGGGPGSISQLRILQEYVTRLAHDKGIDVDEVLIADLFDLIGGVGFGGYVAFLLGPLRMPVSEAIEELVTLGTLLFPEGQEVKPSLEENSVKLKEAIEEMLERHNYPINIKLNDRRFSSSQCKTVVFATPTVDATRCQLFRTYSSREGFLDCTFVQAACATLSMTSLFEPVSIGPKRREKAFTSASIGFNNPTRELIKEAEKHFGTDIRVSTILSIGSGRPALVAFDGRTPASNELLNGIVIDCERVVRELATQLFNVDAYLRLNVDRGMENMKMSDWEGLGMIEGHTETYLAVPAVTKAIDSSLQKLQDRVGAITIGLLGRSSVIKTKSKSVPAVSPYFVVRKEYWDAMEQHLVHSPEAKRKILVLSGMGGCGKTQMVAYFVQEYHSQYKHTFFVDASSLSSIQSDLEAAIRALGEGHEQMTFEDMVEFLVKGAHEGKWLLIFDNADDPKVDLRPYLPECFHGTILITTRNPDLGRLNTTAHLQLGPMGSDEAYETLIRAAHRHLPLSAKEDESTKKLIEELGGLAVALVQAGNYCYGMAPAASQDTGYYAFEQYLLLFKNHRAELMRKGDRTALDRYDRGAYTTFDLSYSLMPQPARELLHLSGFFHHTDLSLAMLECAAQKKFSDCFVYLARPDAHAVIKDRLIALLCPDGRWNELHIHGIIRTLQSFSLASTTSVSATVYLQFHPLVHAWSRDMLSSSDTFNYKQMAMQVVIACTSLDDILLYQFLLPHIMRQLESEPMVKWHVNDQMGFGRVLHELGKYSKAERLFQGALTELEERLGEGDKGTIAASSWLASLYWKQGKWKEAEKMGLEVLEKRQRLLGKDNPDTIRAAANLASIYHSQGKWNEAERMEVEVLEQRQRLFGKDNPDTITAAANLAVTYGQQGQWSEAEIILVEVLVQRQKLLSIDHPDTIMSTALLGYVYYKQGKLLDAERLVAEAVERNEKLAGKEHPNTIAYSKYLSKIRDASCSNRHPVTEP